MNPRPLVLALCFGCLIPFQLIAATGSSGPLTLTVSNTVKTVAWPRPLIPALETNQLFQGLNVDTMTEVPPGFISINPGGYAWSFTNGQPRQFFGLRQGQMSSNALLNANLLNRIAYGPTPDELERLTSIGPQAYLDEQLAMENFNNVTTEPIEAVTSLTTNSGTGIPVNWITSTVTGTVTSSTLYLYLTSPGQLNVDNIQFKYSYVVTAVTNLGGTSTTNRYTNLTQNLLVNGDFEEPLTTGWTVSPILSTSFIDTSTAATGSSSLRMISTEAGTTQSSAIWQTAPAAPANNRGTNLANGAVYTNTISTVRAVLTYSYLPNADSGDLVLRFSGSGLIAYGRDAGPATPNWVYVQATGRATGTPQLYLYLSGPGQVYIDDLKLVAGTAPGVGANLLQNPSFETGVLTPWIATADFVNSSVTTEAAYAGTRSLKLVATAAGGGSGDSLYQANIAGVTSGQFYTLSYWYVADPNVQLTARLSGSYLVASPEMTPGLLRQRLDSALTSHSLSDPRLDDLRGWFCQRAVGAKGQLMEILLQFLENHFVTQHSKTSDYMDRHYDGSMLDRVSTALEYRENARWRQALMDPNCTFYDLLEISAESPAMIIYLDTVGSRGDGDRIANENYARELYELFCMGVDNGYDQNDIVAMSRAWTGWTVNIVDPQNVDNPLAPRAATRGLFPGNGYDAVSNLVGIWTFSYNSSWHGTNRAPILSTWSDASPPGNPIATGSKIYPARFGSPWAGTPYRLTIPARTGSAGMQDGYDVLRHLADLAFTQEYISVKLCRLFVHEDFEHGVYNYTDPNRSDEAELIRKCMVVWQNPGPDGRRGNIRAILRTIFSSELFRSHGGSLQKVKTPLEFLASSVRALRAAGPGGTYTSTTDGYNFIGPLSRMGVMSLFNRADPDGYPETGAPWISAGTLAERLRFTQSYLYAITSGSRPNDAGLLTYCNPVALLKMKLPSGSWNNAGAVADYFLSIIFPGEGKANLDLYRVAAISYLNTGDDGVSASLFASQPNTGTTYDTRVRGLVSLLMTTQRFQEQ